MQQKLSVSPPFAPAPGQDPLLPLCRMKKLLLVIILALGCQLTSTAQADPSTDFKTEALAATRQLAAVVVLDDARLLPVRRLTQARLAQEAGMQLLYANDPAMLRNKLQAIGQEYTAQLSSLLTAAQYQRYLAAAPGALPVTVAPMRLPERTALPDKSLSTGTTLQRKAPTPGKSSNASRQAQL